MAQVKIGNNWILEADSMQWILKEMGMSSPKSSKLEPQFGVRRTTYHATIGQVARWIVQRELEDNLAEADRVMGLGGLQETFATLHNDFATRLLKFIPDEMDEVRYGKS